MADKVVAKYVADVKDYIKEIEKATGIAQKDFEKVNESASGLESGLKKIGGAVAAAFAVDRIVGFTKEASRLAAEGEGIRKAFERIGDPKLLDGLKKATRGTVTELELMKGAVRASNFKIPLEQLGQLFEFARRRAKETGESVDFLVNSIVMGIGRKSPLILDNLGISAIELRKRFDGISIAAADVGDVARIVGEIATEEMQKMGTEALTTADRIKQLETAVGDLTEKYGNAVNESLLFYADLFGVIDLENMEAAKLQAEIAQRDFVDFQRDIKSGYLDLDGAIEKSIKLREKMLDTESEIEAQQNRLPYLFGKQKERMEADIKAKQFSLATDKKRLALMDDYIDALEDANGPEVERIKNVAYYSALLKGLKSEQAEENTTLERNAELINLIADAQEKLNALMGKGKKKSIPFLDEIDEEAKHNVEGMTGAVFDLGEALQSVFGDGAESQIQSELDAMMAATDEQIAADNAATQQRIANIDLYRGVAIDAAYMISDVVIAQTERRIAHEQSLLQKQFEQGLLTQEQFDQKSAELKRKQAQAAKDAATFNAILGTAQAVMQALGSTPPPASYGLAAAAAVMGGVQVALIQSEPLPAFAKGTKDAPSGFKWVGEEGPELIYDGGGYPIITHKESMKILEKYNIETVDLDGIQKGGFGALGESAKLQGFNDRNLLVATDRLRQSNKEGFMYMADRIAESMKKSSRNEW